MDTTPVTTEQDALRPADINANLRFLDKDGNLQLHFEKEATQLYFQEDINRNTQFFHSLEEKLDFLVTQNYYEAEVLAKYTPEFVKEIFKVVYGYKFRFDSLLGAVKFYTSYALRTNDRERFLERYEDRVAMNALTMADGNERLARDLADAMTRRIYQPATPTFLNCARKRRGELVSCFLLRIEDNMESISRSINAALQLSKRGGGVALDITNLREFRSPIKGVKGVGRGPVPVMKILEDAFSYADQLGQRQGAGAVYISVHHPDVLSVLDTKRENADEKVRIKSLSIGLKATDKFMELAAADRHYYAFSPESVMRVYGKALADIDMNEMYDLLVEDSRIVKYRLNARKVLQVAAELEGESGYPYLMFEDTVNRMNPIAGRVSMSNLCTEILQVSDPSIYNTDLTYKYVGRDISCNLGSINVANLMAGKDFEGPLEAAMRALSYVARSSAIDAVPSIRRGNEELRAVGLGLMNLHGYLISQKIHYDSPEAVEFGSVLAMSVNYYSLLSSCRQAEETGSPFVGFDESDYASGKYFDKYRDTDWGPKSDRVRELFADIIVPTIEDWRALEVKVKEYGLYNAYRLAVAPTGSISYINNATASIHPIAERVEKRSEGKTGTVYYAAPGMNNENRQYARTAFELGWRPQIDMYVAIGEHIDQGLSLTLFLPGTITTRDLNQAQIYAWYKGIRTIYYVRMADKEFAGCESCAV